MHVAIPRGEFSAPKPQGQAPLDDRHLAPLYSWLMSKRPKDGRKTGDADLARWTRAVRQQIGLSQEAFGAEIGVSKGAVSQWETGSTAPKLEHLRAIAQHFGVAGWTGIGDVSQINNIVRTNNGNSVGELAEKCDAKSTPSLDIDERRWLAVFQAMAAGDRQMLLEIAEDLSSVERHRAALITRLSMVQKDSNKEAEDDPATTIGKPADAHRHRKSKRHG